jgi:Zn-dependent peptidase ImmA (M78 family)
MPRTSVSALENGHRGLSATELIAISELLRKPLDYFAGAGEPATADEPFPVRFLTLNLQPGDERTVFEFEQCCRDYLWLEEVLNARQLGGPPPRQWPTPATSKEAAEQGEQLATEERNRLDLGIDPIVDPFDVVESQGVRIFVRPLDTPHVSGIFHRDDAYGACILVNSSFHRNRRAFDLLHEYCHILTDQATGTHRTDEDRRSKDPIERRADAFAAAFLMPKEGIAAFLRSRGIRPDEDALDWSDVCRVMVTFGASYEATIYRLLDLGYLDRRVANQFLGMRNVTELTDRFRKSARLPNPNFDDPRVRRYGQLVIRAYAKAIISIGRVAELLAIDFDDAREFVWCARLDRASSLEASAR